MTAEMQARRKVAKQHAHSCSGYYSDDCLGNSAYHRLRQIPYKHAVYNRAEDHNQQRFHDAEYSVLCNSLVDHVRVCKPRFFP